MDWLIVYDEEEISAKTAEVNAKDALFVVDVEFKSAAASIGPP